ncbi:hypothetical protein IWX76_000329 [Pedobacter sp. CAN_A7]|uniref:Arm DNA-binding domain-containing protein n=1 Tax=Pedobacter sp. CAN_A7 TaxID=2787722 RepID=UPI0018C92EF8
MRITVDGKRAEIATSRDCNPSRWSKRSSRLIGTKEDVKMLNSYLDSTAKFRLLGTPGVGKFRDRHNF